MTEYLSTDEVGRLCGIGADMVRFYIRKMPAAFQACRVAPRRGGRGAYAIPKQNAEQFRQWYNARRRGDTWSTRDLLTTHDLAERLCLEPPSVRYHIRRANFRRAVYHGHGNCARTYLDAKEGREFVAWYLSAERERGARFPSLKAEDNNA